MKVMGFSMAEFLLYVCIMTIIMATVTRALVYDYLRSRAALASLHEFCMLSTASDVWVDDMCQASDKKTNWHQSDTQTLIVRCGTRDVSWVLKENTLLRIAGVYDGNKQQWVKKTTSLMATGIRACTFICTPDAHDNHRIHAVHGEIVGAHCNITRSVTLRNGKRV